MICGLTTVFSELYEYKVVKYILKCHNFKSKLTKLHLPGKTTVVQYVNTLMTSM